MNIDPIEPPHVGVRLAEYSSLMEWERHAYATAANLLSVGGAVLALIASVFVAKGDHRTDHFLWAWIGLVPLLIYSYGAFQALMGWVRVPYLKALEESLRLQQSPRNEALIEMRDRAGRRLRVVHPPEYNVLMQWRGSPYAALFVLPNVLAAVLVGFTMWAVCSRLWVWAWLWTWAWGCLAVVYVVIYLGITGLVVMAAFDTSWFWNHILPDPN